MKIRKILFVVIPVVIVLCAVGGFLIWYNQPMNRINRAFEAADYETVVNLYGRLSKEDDIREVENRLIDIAQDYHNDYIKEKCSYKDIKSFFELITEDILRKNKKVTRLNDEIDEVNQSRIVYNDGLVSMENNELLTAIQCFEAVSELDKVYKEKADEYIIQCKNEYIDSVLVDVDVCIELEQYEIAQEQVIDALEIFPDDERLDEKLKEINALMYSDIEGTWSTTYDFGSLIAAEMGISGYKVYFPAELVFVFDGKNMNMYVDENSIRPALDAMTADAESMEALYAVAEDYGVNKFEADILVKLMYGGSYSAFLMDQYGSEINNALASFRCEVAYSADSKKIHLGDNGSGASNNYYNYTTDNGSWMELTSYAGAQNPLNTISYPVKLTRRVR